MEHKKAIPDGYSTTGEAAKKLGTTVRALQYYDKEGLLSPSGQSQGGRRLYSDKDMVLLHQILSLKSLGFSLGEIKHNLISLDSPEQVAKALGAQAQAVKEQMEGLAQSLEALEALRAEVLTMQTVDFAKYTAIIMNLQMNNDFYWMIKHFDQEQLKDLSGRFSQAQAAQLIKQMNEKIEEALMLEEAGVLPQDPRATVLAKSFWDLTVEVTQGDMSLIQKLNKLYEAEQSAVKENFERFQNFIGPALEAHFSQLGINPFEGEAQ